jgi:hypothetical protein
VTSVTLQFSWDEKTGVSWKCLPMSAGFSIVFLLLGGHFKLVLKYLQCRMLKKGFSSAGMLQQAGEMLCALSGGFQKPCRSRWW